MPSLVSPPRPRVANPHLEGLRDLAHLVALVFGGAPEHPDDPVRGLELSQQQLRDIGYEPTRLSTDEPDGRPYEVRPGWLLGALR